MQIDSLLPLCGFHGGSEETCREGSGLFQTASINSQPQEFAWTVFTGLRLRFSSNPAEGFWAGATARGGLGGGGEAPSPPFRRGRREARATSQDPWTVAGTVARTRLWSSGTSGGAQVQKHLPGACPWPPHLVSIQPRQKAPRERNPVCAVTEAPFCQV